MRPCPIVLGARDEPKKKKKEKGRFGTTCRGARIYRYGMNGAADERGCRGAYLFIYLFINP